MVTLADLLPAGEQGWRLLFELAEANQNDWLLIGGQMMFLLAAEYGTSLPRPTVDMDVVVDVRTLPGGTRWLAGWLLERGFTQDPPSADGISHRFTRPVGGPRGSVVFDILAPDGVGARADLTTSPPGRTVSTPGASQAFRRSRLIEVTLRGADGEIVPGRVRRPDLLGALVLKAAATSEITVRQNPERDWQDCALLLAMIPDPFSLAAQVSAKDRRRLRALTPLTDGMHPAWRTLTRSDSRNGAVALSILTGV